MQRTNKKLAPNGVFSRLQQMSSQRVCSVVGNPTGIHHISLTNDRWPGPCFPCFWFDSGHSSLIPTILLDYYAWILTGNLSLEFQTLTGLAQLEQF